LTINETILVPVSFVFGQLALGINAAIRRFPAGGLSLTNSLNDTVAKSRARLYFQPVQLCAHWTGTHQINRSSVDQCLTDGYSRRVSSGDQSY
jgi:hypothetical protein